MFHSEQSELACGFDLTWVSYPCVEDPEALLDPQFALIVEPSSYHLLAEGENVRRPIKLKMLVGPKLACGAATSLDLVHEVNNIVSLANIL